MSSKSKSHSRKSSDSLKAPSRPAHHRISALRKVRTLGSTSAKAATDGTASGLSIIRNISEDLSLRHGIRREFCAGEQADYEKRVLRTLVYIEYAPLGSLFSHSSRYLGEMVYQMMNCLHHLFYDAGVLHQNINYSNIIVAGEGPDGKPLFVLNDFDLATRVTASGTPIADATSKRHRARTLPFTSWETLNEPHTIYERPIVHRLRHDYESLLYVALWCSFMCEEPPSRLKQRIIRQVLDWEFGPLQMLAVIKFELLRDARCSWAKGLPGVPMTPLFEPWRPWFEAWIDAVSPAVLLLRNYSSDLDMVASSPQDTAAVNGCWSRDNILEALRKAEPTLNY